MALPRQLFGPRCTGSGKEKLGRYRLEGPLPTPTYSFSIPIASRFQWELLASCISAAMVWLADTSIGPSLLLRNSFRIHSVRLQESACTVPAIFAATGGTEALCSSAGLTLKLRF